MRDNESLWGSPSEEEGHDYLNNVYGTEDFVQYSFDSVFQICKMI